MKDMRVLGLKHPIGGFTSGVTCRQEGTRNLMCQMTHNGRVLSLGKKQAGDESLEWYVHFFSEGDMHQVVSRVSLADAMAQYEAFVVVYIAMYDRIYKRTEVRYWTLSDLNALEKAGYKREITFTFSDGKHAYVYAKIPPAEPFQGLNDDCSECMNIRFMVEDNENPYEDYTGWFYQIGDSGHFQGCPTQN